MTQRTIHIVDDDDAVRESLRALLAAAGFATAGYASGRAFLAAFQPAWRGCALLDVRLPDVGGLEIQTELARRGATLPIIIVTGHADVPMAVKALKAGAADFIQKPVDEDVLIASIERALAGAARPTAAGVDAGAGERLAQLTPRERDVLELLVIGRTNKEIARALDLSPRTVENHRARVMDKMQAESLSHLVRMAIALGLSVG